MNREIKFRVFIKEQNRCVYVGDKTNDTYINFLEDTWWVYDTFDGKHNLIASSEHDDILMQYTGLKDKNGKNIYEGDIVIWEACDCEIRFGFHVVATDMDGIIIDKAYGFYLWWIDQEFSESITENVEGHCEVIGNIYENPELLK